MICINDGSVGFARELKAICADSPYGARIDAYFTAYSGSRSFLDFWLYKSGGQARGALCRYYGSVFLCGEFDSEIRAFLEMLSPSSVLCDVSLDFEITGTRRKTGETLVCALPVELSPGIPGCTVDRLTGEMRSLGAVYELLRAEYGAPLGEFDDYFVDMSHLIRHNTAQVFTLCADGELASTLTVSAISETAAVIGSVATKREFRRSGLAGYLVSKITKELYSSGRKVFLHREEPIPLYERAGFCSAGSFAQYVRITETGR